MIAFTISKRCMIKLVQGYIYLLKKVKRYNFTCKHKRNNQALFCTIYANSIFY